MRILLISNLFPNSQQPGLAAYNLQQMRALNRHQDIDIEIVAPLPWTPKFLSKRHIPYCESIEQFKVYHPRYFVIPKIFRFLHGISFYFGIKTLVNKLHKEKPVDVVLSAWGWPDVFGSVLICKKLNIPIVANLLGSDIHLHSKVFSRRIQMKWAFKQCQHLVCVSKTLKSRLVDMGIAEQNISVLLNGVDHQKFYPRHCLEASQILQLDEEKKRILFIGNFYPVKGVDILIEAFGLVVKDIKNVELVLVGDGQKNQAIKKQVRLLGLEEQVKFVGRQPHDKTPLWFNACNVFCLPSRSEGCPNVVLEAVACGCRIVASDVGSVSEILENNLDATIVSSENIQALANALKDGLTKSTLINKANQGLWLSWDDNADELRKILSSACSSTS